MGTTVSIHEVVDALEMAMDERRSEGSYWYEAPRFGYSAMLEVTAAGFIRNYPRL
jgi:hypothetical protein